MDPEQKTKPSKASSLARNALRFTGLILFSIFVAELSLLLIGLLFTEHQFLHHADRAYKVLDMKEGELYRPRPGVYEEYQYRINSLGYRGDEIKQKSEGAYRILALGDSTTFGLLFQEEDAWPSLLEESLNSSYEREIEIINMGRVAASSFSTVFDLKNYVMQLEPDALIFSVGWYNDYQKFHKKETLTEIEAIEEDYFREEWETAHSPLMYSRLFRIYRNFHAIRSAKFDEWKTEEWMSKGEFLPEAANHPRRVPLNQFKENLVFMCDFAKERELPSFFLVPEINPRYRYKDVLPEAFPRKYPIVEAYADSVIEVAGKCEATLIRSDELLQKLGKLEAKDGGKYEQTSSIWIDEVHLWPKGNQAIAELVEEALVGQLDEEFRNQENETD